MTVHLNESTAPIDVIDAARRLTPELSERALENERLRTMAPDLVDQMRQAGLFRLALPAELGGLECDPVTIVETIEEVSRADGSAGWTAFIGNNTALLAWLQPSVAREVIGEHPDFVMAGAFAPTGTACPRGDCLVIDGRWAFCSGAPHADWFVGGVIVKGGTSPCAAPPGRPDWRFALYPADQAEILDTWHVAGLRGTGSHDVVARSIEIPAEHTVMPFYEAAQFDGPLYRLPFPMLLMTLISGFPLGVARRALDEFTTMTAKKSRTMPPGPRMADDAAIQVELARAEAAVRSARAFVIESLGASFSTVCMGDDVSVAQRTNTMLAMLNAARSARAAVDTVFGLAGGAALFEDHPLQRCARDLIAGTQHLLLSINTWKTAGRVLCGLEPATHMF
ncbi:MAG: indole-3-acetate monooxygenase [Acidimicrobiia bacterium]|jgi:alkylation response protein AidB-like acyl-CoA dehydrogenase|nr:indole-3-acetate monooxygenase [Acidimicrobiia bacterium]